MHVTTDTTGSQTFSTAIREASRDHHQRAEHSPVLAALIGGRLEPERYAALLAQYRAVYTVLETAAAVMRDDPLAGPFVHDGLTRVPALDADIRVLLDADQPDHVAVDQIVPDDLPPSAATEQYCAHLQSTCFDWPGGFVAHHYVRYLGDLSGGQFIAKVVERTYGVDGERGAQFYRFARIDDLSRFKDAYRRQLDTTPWSTEERVRIIDEILCAYDLNIALHDAMV